MRTAFVLGIAAFVAYTSALALYVSSDATPHVLTAASWIVEGDADLDEYLDRALTSGRQTAAGSVSWYPPGLPLLLTAPIGLALALGVPVWTEPFLAIFGKLAGASAAAASVVFVHLACLRVARPSAALAATVVYAFATSTWAVSGQQVWQHGPSQLFVALGAYLLARDDRRSALAGLALGIATLIRPTNLLVAVGGILATGRGGVARYLAWGLPALGFLLVYDAVVFGSPLAQSYPPEPWTFSSSGYIGLLVSPSRGLFVYSPALIVAVVGLVLAWRRPERPGATLLRASSLAVVGVWLVHGSIAFWWAGHTYGNRYLADVLPVLAVAMAFAIEAGVLASPFALMAFVLAVAWSALLQFAGAGWYYEPWDGRHWDLTPDIDDTPERLWMWDDPQWLFVIRRLILDPGDRLLPAVTGTAIAAVLVWREARRAART